MTDWLPPQYTNCTAETTQCENNLIQSTAFVANKTGLWKNTINRIISQQLTRFLVKTRHAGAAAGHQICKSNFLFCATAKDWTDLRCCGDGRCGCRQLLTTEGRDAAKYSSWRSSVRHQLSKTNGWQWPTKQFLRSSLRHVRCKVI